MAAERFDYRKSTMRLKDTIMASKDRPEIECIKSIMEFEESERQAVFDYVLDEVKDKHPFRTAPVVYQLLWAKEQADQLAVKGHYSKAIEKYKIALRFVSERVAGCTFLTPAHYNPLYISVFAPNDACYLHVDLVSCCLEIARNYVRLNKSSEALKWLQENEILYDCMDLYLEGGLRPEGPQATPRLRTLQYFTGRLVSVLELERIFMKLRNTGSAGYYKLQCRNYMITDFLQGFKEIESLKTECMEEVSSYTRNPEMSTVGSWNIQDPQLQVRGIWNKLEFRSLSRPRGRHECITWLWRNKLYVFGGRIASVKVAVLELWDLWCLDLRNRSWRRMPDLPVGLRSISVLARKAVIHENYAWIFNGHRHVLRFSLTSENWDVVSTTFDGQNWPYKAELLADPCVELFEDCVYVFGGYSTLSAYGLNILMVLNLRTRIWRCLGGSCVEAWPTRTRVDCPPPRRAAASWFVPRERRLYVMYGSSDVTNFLKSGISDLGDNFRKNHYHPDMWSYSIVDEVWNRERLEGNYPCPRDNMSVIYHPGFDAVLVFGGTNNDVPLSLSEFHLENSEFTFYGDTFIMDVSTRSWRQVVTRSFPCWRKNSHFLFEHSTGQLYLFGGSSSKNFIDHEMTSSDYPSYHFKDLWTLELDLLGYNFDESRFFSDFVRFKAGKWRYCYVCKRVGKGYLKCQGTCGGKFVFCSVGCQRTAWKDHRRTHGCRRIH